MIYKDKVLILHQNSIFQDRIAEYLRETGYAVIQANNLESAFTLSKSLRPDIIVWGETLTAASKKTIKSIKDSHFGSEMPIIVISKDLELYDRIELEKNGINDILGDKAGFTELKLKIRYHLRNARRIRMYDEEIRKLQNISELQYNLSMVHDTERMCELINDFVMTDYKPEFLITLLLNHTTQDLEYKQLALKNGNYSENHKSLFDHPVWKRYFFSNTYLKTEQVVEKQVVDFFGAIDLKSDLYYQFPLRAQNKYMGLILIGLGSDYELSRNQMSNLSLLFSTLATRVVDVQGARSARRHVREDTSEIQYLFQRLNEDEIFDYLSQQLLSNLKADVCIYFNYNEGFRFLYPQYCYKTGREKNLFEDEKPPVLLIKDFPKFEDFLQSRQPSKYYNLVETKAPGLETMAGLAGGKYASVLIFTVKIENEIKGFFIVANETLVKRFTNSSIQEAEQLIHRATNLLMESRVVRQAQQTIKQLDRIFKLGKEITLDIHIDKLLSQIASSLRKTLGWNVVLVYRKNDYLNSYENAVALGMQEVAFAQLNNRFPDSMYPVVKERSFIISNSYFFDHNYMHRHIDDADKQRFKLTIGKEWNDNDWLLVPIMSRGKELGVIIVNDPVERLRPTSEKVRSIEYFANQAAVALENAALYENLKASEIKYRLLAETMTMGLVACAAGGEIIYSNKSFSTLMKYESTDNLLGQNLLDLCSDKTRNAFEKHVLATIKVDQNDFETALKINEEGIEIELLDTNHDYIPFKTYLAPYFQTSKKIGFLGVLADQRPQRRLERLKADFNSMIVHDLRSPLNIIQGYIDIVKNQVVGQISSEQEELLGIAKENVNKVLKLIDNFLTASKLEVGKFQITIETHSLNTLMETVYEENLVLTKKKSINLQIQTDPNISLLQFDRLRIEQVLNNYISNAIKFTASGGIISIGNKLVRKHNEISGEDVMEVHVWVADSGVGIAKEELVKVFNKYEQTEAGKDAAIKGTGLGLAICKEIITLHKGQVWVESEPGKGSTFYFSLPITPLKI